MTKILFIFGLLVTTEAQAELVVVQDLGGIPLAAYVDTRLVPSQATLAAALPTSGHGSIDPASLLIPGQESEFSPGKVDKHRLNLNVPTPFYLVGGDNVSIRWLTENAAYLKSIQAEGFIVDVPSVEAIKSIEAKTGLVLLPGNVAGLSKAVGTVHYPFLVYHGWVLQ